MQVEHKCTVDYIAYANILNGSKTVEVRSSSGWYHVGLESFLVFHTLGIEGFVRRKVIRIRNYNSVGELLEHEDIQKILPGVSSKDEAIVFLKSTVGDIKVVAFEMQNIGKIELHNNNIDASS